MAPCVSYKLAENDANDVREVLPRNTTRELLVNFEKERTVATVRYVYDYAQLNTADDERVYEATLTDKSPFWISEATDTMKIAIRIIDPALTYGQDPRDYTESLLEIATGKHTIKLWLVSRVPISLEHLRLTYKKRKAGKARKSTFFKDAFLRPYVLEHSPFMDLPREIHVTIMERMLEPLGNDLTIEEPYLQSKLHQTLRDTGIYAILNTPYLGQILCGLLFQNRCLHVKGIFNLWRFLSKLPVAARRNVTHVIIHFYTSRQAVMVNPKSAVVKAFELLVPAFQAGNFKTLDVTAECIRSFDGTSRLYHYPRKCFRTEFLRDIIKLREAAQRLGTTDGAPQSLSIRLEKVVHVDHLHPSNTPVLDAFTMILPDDDVQMSATEYVERQAFSRGESS